MLLEFYFSQYILNKYVLLMVQGNGYFGFCVSYEEDYMCQMCGMYLVGFYYWVGKGEINELVNLFDVVGMEIVINGEVFLLFYEVWQRELDFVSGELCCNVVWCISNGVGYIIVSCCFVLVD